MSVLTYAIMPNNLFAACQEVFSISHDRSINEAYLFSVWLEDGAGHRTGFLNDETIVEEIPGSDVAMECIGGSNDLEASAEDSASPMREIRHISVVKPQPAMHLFIKGDADTAFSIEVDRIFCGKTIENYTVSGTVEMDETKEVKLVPPKPTDGTPQETEIKTGTRQE
ncbi:MAG: hypothetical protein IPP35_07085 [Elusimicrobia bacterium]|nr:hypothetical protein [Elusimicrobiota bacterium]